MLNESNCILVCDYYIDDTAFKNALIEYTAAVKAKEDAEKNAEYKAEVDDWADNAFPSTTKKSESLIQHSYSIYESYLALYRIKNEADDKQNSDNTQKEIVSPNEADFIASDRFGETGRILKTAFLYGPSKSVLENGKQIYITIDGTADKDEIAANKAEQDNKNKNNNENLRKHNSYSIYESCLSLNKMKNEADDTSTNNQQEQTMKDTDTFKSGSTWVIKVMLKDEGYSEWKIFINNDVPRTQYDTIKGLLKKGKFREAYYAAGKSSKGIDGIVPISCKTYINKKPICGIPWFGHCRYGFLPGAEDNDPAIANTLFLSVAPFDATKGAKPDAKGSSDKAIVFKAAYNITGDISHGKLNSLLSFAKRKIADQIDKAAGRSSNYSVNDDNKLDDDIAKFLKNTFRCIGDSTMYQEFIKIRDYLSKELGMKTKAEVDTKDGKQVTQELDNANLQINTDESTTDINSYANQVKSKNALIFY